MTELGLCRRFHLGLAATVAAAACALDLTSKWAATASSFESVRFNQRPPFQLLPFLAVALALLVATSLAGSTPLDVAAGALAGEAVANIASTFVWRQGIPDFIPAHGVLLNLGDLTIAVGVAGLVGVSLVLACRERRLRHV